MKTGFSERDVIENSSKKFNLFMFSSSFQSPTTEGAGFQTFFGVFFSPFNNHGLEVILLILTSSGYTFSPPLLILLFARPISHILP